MVLRLWTLKCSHHKVEEVTDNFTGVGHLMVLGELDGLNTLLVLEFLEAAITDCTSEKLLEDVHGLLRLGQVLLGGSDLSVFALLASNHLHETLIILFELLVWLIGRWWLVLGFILIVFLGAVGTRAACRLALLSFLCLLDVVGQDLWGFKQLHEAFDVCTS